MGTGQDCGQTRSESTISYRAICEPVKLQHLCRIWQFEWSRPACTENSTLRIAGLCSFLKRRSNCQNPTPTITGYTYEGKSFLARYIGAMRSEPTSVVSNTWASKLSANKRCLRSACTGSSQRFSCSQGSFSRSNNSPRLCRGTRTACACACGAWWRRCPCLR